MKVAFDENIPPAIFRVMDALSQAGDIEGVEFCSARDYSPGPRARTDIPWIQNFVNDDGDLLITGEVQMRSIPEIYAAIAETGVKAYFLPRQWNNWGMAMRVGFILNWWERVLLHAEAAQPGESWIIPSGWTTGTFKQVVNDNED